MRIENRLKRIIVNKYMSSMKLEGKVNFVLVVLFTSSSQHIFCNAVSYSNVCIFIMQLTLIIMCFYCKTEPSSIMLHNLLLVVD